MKQPECNTSKRYCANKLAEIDFMLCVIEKEEIVLQSDKYMAYVESYLKTLLERRLLDFAQAEIYRDLSEENKLKAS